VSELSSRGDEEPLSELGPLPAGHHGLSREQVVESQRERLIAGIAHVVAERGYGAATINEIVASATVSSRAFYENFASKEECFLAAFDAVVDHMRDVLATAAATQEDWPHRVIAALRAALDFFEAEPDLARLCVVEPVTATPVIAAHFRETVVSCIPYLEPGRAERADSGQMPESTEDSLLGGLVILTSRSILAAAAPLPALLPDLVEFVFAPYLGPTVARGLAREAASEAN
jgi:AcrR family transcriptional regulator